MTTQITSPDLSLIQFKAELGSSEASSIFEIELHGNRYALKVFHDHGDPVFTKKGRDLNRFRNEAKAYNNLHSFDVCDSGLVPKYYGSIDRIDPSCHKPWLDSFLNDKFHPSAILLEYLAGSEPLNCVNYSKERLSKAMESLVQVHEALIVHNDLYPENILIVPGTPERVVVMDFDVAETFPTKELQDQAIGIHSPEPMQACKFEFEILKSLGKHLEEDQKEGLPPNTKFY
ncbi:uncharacterized protein N7479_004751 [Penicillium vulpinum]|uniref:Protein kinase domain-containing protein n=1 Tax=Penicillium vulpinum TaxID=29845 RepID=A0A1V6RSR2_9EURO|nr:uncharacterized protein N7479_004751 [Penicillium vulpinum]KAJ5964875.1 hypothetical protein N7479_004751 [Penicillium vulpinum]OQE04608.1 hypothetical protein PENVUL_c031G01523 [Penicillium vulpinum]